MTTLWLLVRFGPLSFKVHSPGDWPPVLYYGFGWSPTYRRCFIDHTRYEDFDADALANAAEFVGILKEEYCRDA